MQQLINKPSDPYSPLWNDYWEQNPHLHRGVGADGDNGDGGEGGDGEGQPSLEDLQAQVKAFEAEKAKILANRDEVLGELKTFKQKAREAEEAAEAARKEKLQKEGDHEQLYKSSEAEREKLANQLQELQNNIYQEKVGNQAMKLAAEMADGYNAELLAEQIQKRLKYTDDGVKVTDASGELTVSSLDDLKAEFKNSERFQALLRGNQASGGGAPGGKGGADHKQVTRSQFDSMDHAKRSKFVKDGGKVIDD